MSIRAFAAITIPEGLRTELGRIERELSSGGRLGHGVSWVRPENVHLTIKFLGEIDEAAVERAKAALHKASGSARPFRLRASGVGSFPPGNRPRVIWVGLDSSAALSELHGAVEEKLAEAGFARENRELSPHLTVCRIKTDDAARAARETLRSFEADLDFPFDVDSFALFRSVLAPKGPTYTELKRFKLAG